MEKIKPSEAFLIKRYNFEKDYYWWELYKEKLAEAFDTLAEKVERLEEEKKQILMSFSKQPEAEPKKEKTLAEVLFEVYDRPKFDEKNNIIYSWDDISQAAKEHFARMIDETVIGVPIQHPMDVIQIIKKRLEAM